MGRIRDTFKTLLGRSEAQVEIARMRGQWAALQLDISNTMEKLEQLAGRLAKRESRAAARAVEAIAGPPVPEAFEDPIHGDRWYRKAEILRKRRGTKKNGKKQREAVDVGSDQAG